MICIYSPGNTNYSNNGDAVLIPISCTLTMTINGAWQLDLEHPYDAEERYKLIQEGAVIRADIKCVGEQSTIRQRFRIYTYNRGVNSVTCIAFPIAMEATFDAPIDNLVLENKTASEAVAQLQALTQKYSIETNVTGTKSTSYANTNINSALASGDDGCFIQVWGGEVVYDNLKFDIRSRIGSDTGYKIQYGHNMTGIDYSKDDSGLSTRVHPISEDGIRLNGTGYVDSPLIDNYPIHHDRYMITPYRLVDTEEASPSRTAQETRACVSAVTSATTTLSQSSYATALGAGYQPDYIKTISPDIITAVQNMALANVISADLYKLLSDTIRDAMAWLADLTQPEWGWMGSDETGWRYGNTNGYAKDMYVRIGKTWSYFGSQGYWEEPKDDKEEWDWHQKEGEGRRYGNFNKYFAHNTFVYITMEGTLQEYWFNEEGWYEADESGESEWSWHGSGTSEDPYWFGEEGATSEDPKKYAHDTWLFIDGAYYFFDSYGYYAPNTAILDYQWDWVQDDERWWFGNAINREFAAVYVESQWLKINGTWYYFDEDGYVVDQDSSKSDAIAVFTTGMASLLTTVNTRKDALYTLLYALMTEWVNKKYTEGIDKPALTVTVSMADLSRTTEYANFAALETIKLGDSVEIDDTEHGIHTTGSRVIGLTYDVIRGYNSNVVIGKPQATVSSMLSQASGQAVAGGFDTSAIEAQIDALQDRVSDVRYNGRSLLQGTIAILDSIGGTSINYGTSTPTGGSDGDVYFQTDSNGNIVKIWQNHSGVWGGMTGGGDISYGVDIPSGGNDGDVYLQVGGETSIITPPFAHNYINQTAISESGEKLSLTLAGTKAGEEAYVAYKVSGLAPNTKYGVKFKATYTGATTTSDSNKFGLFVADEYSFNNLNAYYVEFTKDNAEHEYVLFFDSENEEAIMWFQFGGLSNGEMSLAVSDMWLLGLEVGSPSYSIAYNNKYTAFTQNSFSRTSGGYQFDLTVRTDSTAEWIAYKVTGLVEGARYKVAFSEQMTGISHYYGGTHKYGMFIDDERMTYASYDLIKKKCTYVPFNKNNSKSYYEAEYIAHGTDTYLWVQTGALGDGGTANIVIEDLNITPIAPYEPNLKIIDIWLNKETSWVNSNFSASGGGEVTDVEIDGVSILDTEGVANIPTMSGATSSTDGVGGLVPQPLMTDAEKFLGGDGTWKTVQGGGGSNLIIDAQRYSLEEQVVGVWIDGKPLYELTLNCGQAPNNGTANYNLPSNNYEYIMITEGCLYNPTTKASLPLNLIRTDNSQYSNGCFLAMEQNQIRVNDASDRRAFNVYVTIQYTKTTDTAGSGGFQAYGFTPAIYSEQERVVGVWVDNRPLYEKTYVFKFTDLGNRTISSSVLSGYYALPHEEYGRIWVHDGLIKCVPAVEGGASLTSLKGTPLNYSAGNTYTRTNIQRNASFNNSYPFIFIENTYGTGELYKIVNDIVVYVVLRYTKLADTAGSGEYNTLAIPNVHYSTDEQVIGTWIDGKPLYQKVLDFNSTTINARVDHDVSSLNIETLVDYKGWAQRITGSSKYIIKDGYVLSSQGQTYSFYVRYYATGQQIQTTLTLPSGESTDRQVVIIQYTKTTD